MARTEFATLRAQAGAHGFREWAAPGPSSDARFFRRGDRRLARRADGRPDRADRGATRRPDGHAKAEGPRATMMSTYPPASLAAAANTCADRPAEAYGGSVASLLLTHSSPGDPSGLPLARWLQTVPNRVRSRPAHSHVSCGCALPRRSLTVLTGRTSCPPNVRPVTQRPQVRTARTRAGCRSGRGRPAASAAARPSRTAWRPAGRAMRDLRPAV